MARYLGYDFALVADEGTVAEIDAYMIPGDEAASDAAMDPIYASMLLVEDMVMDEATSSADDGGSRRMNGSAEHDFAGEGPAVEDMVMDEDTSSTDDAGSLRMNGSAEHDFAGEGPAVVDAAPVEAIRHECEEPAEGSLDASAGSKEEMPQVLPKIEGPNVLSNAATLEMHPSSAPSEPEPCDPPKKSQAELLAKLAELQTLAFNVVVYFFLHLCGDSLAWPGLAILLFKATVGREESSQASSQAGRAACKS